jgi:SAM-dependent methyltransferase
MSASPVPVRTGSDYDRFSPDAFSRDDDSDDRLFYARDRFVSHLDSLALSTIERIIGALVTEKRPIILDLMASWDSHLPESLDAAKVVGLGLNQNELAANSRLSEVLLHDLSSAPELPFPDNCFDAVINTVSVDYLTRPFEVFAEVGRILKPGGLFLVIFSNRMFPKKAVKIWREATDLERVDLVRSFFESSGRFEGIKVFSAVGRPRPESDKYAHLGLPSDPVYSVYAEKSGGDPRRNPRPELSGALLESQADHLKAQDENAVCDPAFCPHCGHKLKKWAVPDNPLVDSAWSTEWMFICFNDWCPYLRNGWEVMMKQGRPGMSYRYMYDPERKACAPMLVTGLHDLRYGIVEDGEDEPELSTGSE